VARGRLNDHHGHVVVSLDRRLRLLSLEVPGIDHRAVDAATSSDSGWQGVRSPA
jgi:hypothetical protein